MATRIALCFLSLASFLTSSTADIYYCDNNCASVGLHCIINNPNGFTQCDSHGNRFVKQCGAGTIFDSKVQVCVLSSSKVSNCTCPNPIPVSSQPQQSKAADLVDAQCLACICQVETGCNLNYGCSGGYCGPYRISNPYYIDCEAGGSGYEQCTRDKTCSEKCIQGYMKRYAQNCVGSSRAPTCQDFARIHDVGINGCNDPQSLPYWRDVETCLGKNSSSSSSQPAKSGTIDSKCFSCLCKAETGCNETVGCTNDGFCGPYHISKAYYDDCGVDGGGYVACTTNKACAEQCIQKYMDRYISQCAASASSPTCGEVAMVHKGGPYGCKQTNAIQFSKTVKNCFSTASSIQACFSFCQVLIITATLLTLMTYLYL